MTPDSSQETNKWYVLNYIGDSFRDTPQKTVDRFNKTEDSSLELFAPTYVVRENKQGELKFRTVNLTFHYVFLKGSFEEVKSLCGQPNGFSFLIDHGNSERYATIEDRDMAHFKNIARAYKNCLPYFPLNDIDLEDGDLVEVIKGDFPGLVGYYMPVPKSKSGNIILKVFNNVGTVAFNVNVTDIRVLEFSRNSTRANDQIDAFVPNLLKALRSFNQGEALTTGLAAKLSIFTGRMEVVKLNNRKLDARLQILLYAANRIIGNNAEANVALEKFRKVESAVTNEWTNGLILLILSVLTKDRKRLVATHDRLSTLPATSKAQQLLLTEYDHYLTL